MSFSGFPWAAEDVQGIPVDLLRGLPGETEPAEAPINDVHGCVQLPQDLFFTFLQTSDEHHPPGIHARLWGRSLQHLRYFFSVPHIVASEQD